MKLVRLAILYFHTKESDWMRESWRVRLADVVVSSQKIGNAPEITDKQRQLVFASTILEKQPIKTPDNYLIVPEEERRKAEQAIETVANIFSVIERCQRDISSPFPCIAFLPETDDEFEWLESSSGIYAQREAIPDARFKLNLDDDLIYSLLDRLKGVALLAEALAHKNATGKYHEFVRLYEHAFHLPLTLLDKKIFNFLSGANLGYTRDEINQWIKFRHPSTHADFKKTKELVFEADIKRYIPRMEQAAYDLLINKNKWHSAETERRNIWKPDNVTVSSNGDLRMIQGERSVFQFQSFDEFNSYPFDLNGFLPNLPKGFWSK
jgi:hypothetical protein